MAGPGDEQGRPRLPADALVEGIGADVLVREIRRGDATTLTRIARENAEYYVELAPDDFRVADQDGFEAFLEPDEGANTATMLSLVAEIDGEVARGRSGGAKIALCDTYLGSPVSLPFWERRMGYSRRSVRLRKPLV